MSVLFKIILLLATLAITVIPALAFTDGLGSYGEALGRAVTVIPAEGWSSHPSEFLVWGFLGCCALIIVAQVAPLIRNVRKQSKIAAEQTKTVKQQ